MVMFSIRLQTRALLMPRVLNRWKGIQDIGSLRQIYMYEDTLITNIS